MAERGDHQRQMAAMERHWASQHRIQAHDATTDHERDLHQRAAWSSDEAALLHDYLAGLYDRQDEERTSLGLRAQHDESFRQS
jgi:hypothetical protein